MELTPEQKEALNVAHYLAGVLSGNCTGNTLEAIAEGCAMSIEKTSKVLTKLVEDGWVLPLINPTRFFNKDAPMPSDERLRRYELVQESLPIVNNMVTNLLAIDDAEKGHKNMKGTYEEMKAEVEDYKLMLKNFEKGMNALMSPREGSQ